MPVLDSECPKETKDVLLEDFMVEDVISTSTIAEMSQIKECLLSSH
jgi:hypothetical protein